MSPSVQSSFWWNLKIGVATYKSKFVGRFVFSLLLFLSQAQQSVANTEFSIDVFDNGTLTVTFESDCEQVPVQGLLFACRWAIADRTYSWQLGGGTMDLSDFEKDIGAPEGVLLSSYPGQPSVLKHFFTIAYASYFRGGQLDGDEFRSAMSAEDVYENPWGFGQCFNYQEESEIGSSTFIATNDLCFVVDQETESITLVHAFLTTDDPDINPVELSRLGKSIYSNIHFNN